MEYITKNDKNGKARFYKVVDGKMKPVSRAEYEAHISETEVDATETEPVEAEQNDRAENEIPTVKPQNGKRIAGFKQSRWVKVHQRGQANYAEKDNVMDIMIGDSRCQAEVLYTVRSYKKAAEWLLKYLESAEAIQLVIETAEKIMGAVSEASRDSEEITVAEEHWMLGIEKMADGAYKVRMTWESPKAEAENSGTAEAIPA